MMSLTTTCPGCGHTAYDAQPSAGHAAYHHCGDCREVMGRALLEDVRRVQAESTQGAHLMRDVLADNLRQLAALPWSPWAIREADLTLRAIRAIDGIQAAQGGL